MKKVLLTLLILTSLPSFAQDAFITTWRIDDPSNTTITIPTKTSANTYNYEVDWNNDGVYDQTGVTGNVTHDFGSTGTYTIRIRGQFPAIHFNYSSDRGKIIDVNQWGTQQWRSMHRAFNGCNNLEITATDVPDLTNVTDMSNMFNGATKLNSPLNNWDVSNVTDMRYMFAVTNSFNQPLDNWDVSSVINMDFMFYNATSFNQTLNNWNVSNVTTMEFMFSGAATFNQPLNNWDVENVTKMGAMFSGAVTFNRPLNNWKVNNVTDMSAMFSRSTDFNQPLHDWNTSSVTNMSFMFNDAANFNQPLNNWNVTNVTSMVAMFQEGIFDQPLNDWVVDNVTNTASMFRYAVFNQPLDNWNVSNVTDMSGMFGGNEFFNQSINTWDVGNVTDMGYMFQDAVFNQPLDNWNVGNVIDMNYMFEGNEFFNQNLNSWNVNNVKIMFKMFQSAKAFNQSLDGWNVSNVTDMKDMFLNVKLSTKNYDDTLIAWSTLTLQPNVSFSGGDSQYCTAEAERQSIIDTFNWSINDSGKECKPDCTTITLPSTTTNVAIDTNISWVGVAEATSYNLIIGTSSGANDIVNETGLTSTTYDIPANLAHNTTYYVVVIPVNVGDVATGCSEFSFTTIVEAPNCTTVTLPSSTTNIAVNTDISWSAVTGATSYNLTIGTSSGASDIINETGLINTTYDIPTDLAYGTTYYVNVIPVNTGGTAIGCSEFSFTTIVEAPSCTTVTLPSSTANIALDTDISWSAVAEATSYNLTIGTSSGASDIVNETGLTSTTYDIPVNLAYNTTYYVTVTPVNAGGIATGCSEFSFTTIIAPPSCAVITLPSATTNVAIDTNISWDAVAEAISYNLTIGTSLGASNVVNETGLTSIIYDIPTDLAYNTTYYVNVIPVNTGGTAKGCSEFSFTTIVEAPSCTTVILPSTTTNTAVDTDISWNALTEATSYKLTIGTSSGASDIVSETGLTNTIYDIPTDLAHNTTYYVTVIPVNAGGIATGCSEFSFTTIIEAPSCTTITLPNSTTNVLVDTDVSWSAVTEATSYNLTIGTVSGANDLVNETGLTITTYDIPTDLAHNTTYYVTVIPVNTGGAATGCTEFSFTTIVEAPNCTTVTLPSSTTNIAVDTDISWNAVAEATSYNLTIGTSSGASDVANETGLTNTIYDVSTDLTINTTYYVTITPVNIGGLASGCSEFSFITTSCIPVDAGENGSLTICAGETPTDAELFAALQGTPDADGSWNRVDNTYTYTVSGSNPCKDAFATVTITEIPIPNVGEDGFYISTNKEKPTNTTLLKSLKGNPDSNGTWEENADGNYIYKISNTSKCEATAMVKIIYIPELFSPNGDGANERFFVEGLEEAYPDFGIKIFDRSGKERFNSSVTKWWDGIDMSTQKEAPEGTYFYVITINNSTKQGWIYLKR